MLLKCTISLVLHSWAGLHAALRLACMYLGPFQLLTWQVTLFKSMQNLMDIMHAIMCTTTDLSNMVKTTSMYSDTGMHITNTNIEDKTCTIIMYNVKGT